MKTVALMQPYLFPYLGYFQAIAAADEYIIYDDVQYIKGGWINRNNILMGGQKSLFTIILDGASPNKLISELSIKDDFTKFLKTVDMAYHRAPYHDVVMPILQKICAFDDRRLARFTGHSFMEILQYAGVAPTLRYSSDIAKTPDLKGQDRVLDICRQIGAERYINAIGGQELYDRAAFAAAGIELKFISMKPVEYRQLGKPFVPNLSIIDVMMFNSGEEVRTLLGAYELV